MPGTTQQTQETVDTAEQQDQVIDTTEDSQQTEGKEDAANVDKAVKTSEDFDKLLDSEGVEDEETPPAKEQKEDKQDKSEAETDTETDDKDSGKDTGGQDKTGVDDEPKVSAELAKKAVDLGLTEEEIATFDDDAELQKTLSVIESISAEEDGAADDSQGGAEKKDEEPKSVLKFKNEADIDPEILESMKAMEQHYQGEVKQLREAVAAMQAGVAKQQQDQFIARFDKMVDGLGIEFADVFGKGPTVDLSRRSQAFRNRDAIRARMYAFAKGLSDAKLTVPDEQGLFDMAINALHGKKLEAVKNTRKSDKAKRYAKGARAGRSATKTAGNVTPLEKAYQTSRNFDALIDTSE